MRPDPRPILCLTLTLCLAASLAVTRAGADPIAVLASAKGNVEVTGARGGAVRATFGRPLERGDRVSVGAGGSATVFFSDGNFIELAPRSSITIGGRTPASGRGAALSEDVFAQVSRSVTAGSRQTGLVALADMRSDADTGAPMILAPRATALLDAAPALRWRSVPGATRYRVELAATAGGTPWSRELDATSAQELTLTYPADQPPLAGGQEYRWEVQAVDAKGTLRRESTVVRLLPSAARDSVRANLDQIASGAGGEGSAAARFLAGSYLAGLGLYGDAAPQFLGLVSLAPDSPVPHEALGNLYLAVGLSDRAAAEFQQALALRKEAR